MRYPFNCSKINYFNPLKEPEPISLTHLISLKTNLKIFYSSTRFSAFNPKVQVNLLIKYILNLATH